jgi:hypothetical protein
VAVALVAVVEVRLAVALEAVAEGCPALVALVVEAQVAVALVAEAQGAVALVA